MPAASTEAQPCPCGSAADWEVCCAPIIRGDTAALTAAALMRSRYSAYVVEEESYLLASWHPQTRPSRIRFTAGQRWLGLQVKNTAAGGVDDDSGTVEFVARYKINGRGHRLHEVSRFERLQGAWYYLDGQHLN